MRFLASVEPHSIEREEGVTLARREDPCRDLDKGTNLRHLCNCAGV